MVRRCLEVVAVAAVVMLVTAPGVARAAPPGGVPDRRVIVDAPEVPPAAAASVSHTIYLERCKGDCTITKGTSNNATAMTSSIPSGTGTFKIKEYRSGTGEIGASADAEWAQLVQCMREVYSPFDVVVTDVKPTTGTYHLAMIAGLPADIGLSNDILGIAPLAGNCAAQDNVISFSFANAHAPQDRVHNLCWTAAQESAHAFGLDHEYEFADKRSACSDPMTYRVDCGGQRFFRNFAATCGENAARPCKCSATQNSHQKLTSVFGAGTPITPPPVSTLVLPQASGTLDAVVAAKASSQRGVTRVEMRINGFGWAELKGAPFGAAGQPETLYTIPVPASLPHSLVDVTMRAYDDLGAFTDSATVTVSYGAPCTSADTCAAHQKCEAGKCLWDPPTGELGDSCSYPQACKSNLCTGTADQQICTELCVPSNDTCPDGLVCASTGPDSGICFPPDGGGCCSVGGSSGTPWGHATLALLAIAAVTRRRRS